LAIEKLGVATEPSPESLL